MSKVTVENRLLRSAHIINGLIEYGELCKDGWSINLQAARNIMVHPVLNIPLVRVVGSDSGTVVGDSVEIEGIMADASGKITDVEVSTQKVDAPKPRTTRSKAAATKV